MAEWSDILTNRTDYPDDEPIQLKNGQTVTIGALRAAALPKSDYSRESERWAREKQQLAAEKEQLAAQAQGYAAQLQQQIKEKNDREAAAAAAAGRPSQAGQFTWDDLKADPAFRLVTDRWEQMEAAQKKLDEKTAELERARELHQQTWLKREYDNQLKNISDHWNGRYNKDGKNPFDQTKFFDFVKVNALSRNGLVDLAANYREFVSGDELRLAVQEAEERGIEKGKKAAMVPPVGFGKNIAPVRDKSLPASLQEITTEMLLNDPDMQAAMRGDVAA